MEQNKEVAKKTNRTRVSYKVKQEEQELQNRIKEWYNQKKLSRISSKVPLNFVKIKFNINFTR